MPSILSRFSDEFGLSLEDFDGDSLTSRIGYSFGLRDDDVLEELVVSSEPGELFYSTVLQSDSLI